jgi:phospho-N-acetylmuramoyl-pentapeptide-transferase
VRAVLVAALVALLVSILCTPVAIRLFRRQGFGQEIRDDGPQSHQSKRGTPTMGGAVIIFATLIGYFVAHLIAGGRGPTASGLLLLYLFTGLGGVGFLDDFIKIRKQRSLGLNATAKFVGQLAVGVSFAILALQFKDSQGRAPASTFISYVRDIPQLGMHGPVGGLLFVLFAYLLISGFSNAVNLTDGLDGLAAGSSAMVFGAYTAISFYQFRNACETSATAGCYQVRDPLDVALIAAAAMAACFGFLWWNASPARIFMGDTGSLALGGLMAGIAMMSKTELLLVVLGGLFVVETLSVMLQVTVFKWRRKRLFNMAPIHHHFELAGWAEMTVIVRFWIVAGLAVAFGMGLFYAEFISYGLPG